MSKVDLFGTFHIDRPSKVKNELREFTHDTDVVFIEQPREEPTATDMIALLGRNPALWITSWLLEAVWGLLGFLVSRRFNSVDGGVTRAVAREQHLHREPVDMNLVQRASAVSLPVTIVSWGWALLCVGVFISGLMQSLLVFVSGAVVIGILPGVPFACWTLAERDRVMASNIQHVLSTRNDVQRGCLVVGQGHIDGISAELDESPVNIGDVHASKLFRRSL